MKNMNRITGLIFLLLLINSCLKEKATPPVLITSPVIAVSNTSVASGGVVSDEGSDHVVSRGVCWNTSPNPTIKNNITVDGSGLGSFVSNITNLVSNTTYYLRAYAINSTGTGYGDEVSFKILANGTIVLNGLIAYYPFNGNVNDESGYSNNGTNYGASPATDRKGNPGRAMSFNGTSNYIQIPTSSSFQSISSEITISAWLKKGSASLQEQIIVSRRDNTDPGIHFVMQISPLAGLLFLTGGVGTPNPGYTYLQTQTTSYPKLNDGNWHNVVAVHKYGTGTSSALYIDGVLVASTWLLVGPNYPVNIKNVDVFIGKQNVAPPSSGFANGYLDDIRIYNRALTLQEIVALNIE
jgi:hypothetical protein